MAEKKIKTEQLNNVDEVKYVDSNYKNVVPEAARIVEKVMSQKRVSVNPTEVLDTVNGILSAIKYFNSLDEYAEIIFNGNNIADVKVLNEFKDLIVPSAVRFDPTDIRSKDLSVKELPFTAPPMTYYQYVKYCDTFRSYLKADCKDKMTSLSELKKPVALTSVIDKSSNNIGSQWKVTYGSEAFYPIRLTNLSILFEDRHYNATEEDLVSDYLAHWTF